MYILGISCYYHDSAACLINDGKILAAAEEERFTRRKFDDDFPRNAIDYCLKEGGISGSQLDYVSFYDKSILKFERLLDNYIAVAPRGLTSFVDVMPKWLHRRLWIKDEIQKYLGYNGKIMFPEHHMSHAAYSFFTSNFSESAIMTVDGVGEWTTASFGSAVENKINLIHDIRWPHSIGLLYSAFTYYLGFKVNEGEYKVMGMAAYGEPTFVELIKKEIVDVKDDGSINLNMKYFSFHYGKTMVNNKFEELFGCPVRKEDSEITQAHYDIAASIQVILEEILLKMINYVYRCTNQKKLCLGGGVALNGLANFRILKEGPFDDIYIPPAPGDAGSAVGCALFTYYSQLKQNRQNVDNQNFAENIYLGPEYSNEEIFNFLSKYKIPHEKLARQKLIQKVAKILSEKKVVGWYQGRMEFGPRALGNRSILADPREENMKNLVNEKIKHRERFRPFAPSVLADFVSEYFETEVPSPYMLLVTKVKKPEKIPAVTHVDGTARIQTVSRKDNPLYYDLISEFYNITGIPVLLNTSMNVRHEPIVNTPNEAFNMILKTDIDYMAMGNYLITK